MATMQSNRRNRITARGETVRRAILWANIAFASVTVFVIHESSVKRSTVEQTLSYLKYHINDAFNAQNLGDPVLFFSLGTLAWALLFSAATFLTENRRLQIMDWLVPLLAAPLAWFLAALQTLPFSRNAASVEVCVVLAALIAYNHKPHRRIALLIVCCHSLFWAAEYWKGFYQTKQFMLVPILSFFGLLLAATVCSSSETPSPDVPNSHLLEEQ